MNRNVYRYFYIKAYAIFIVAALILFIALFSSYQLVPLSYEGKAKPITDVTLSIDGSEETKITLPTKLNNLAARTQVTLYAQFKPEPYDILQIKSVFSPMALYIDEVLIYESGQPGTYPAFMNDPPTIITTVPLPESANTLNMRIEYLSLSQRTVLSLPAIFVGSQGELLMKQFKENGFSLLFSFILVFTGLYMVLIYIALSRKVPSGILFLWLGLFSISTGFWVFGECDLSAFILPRHSLLYAMDYIGLFTVAIPFLKFGMTVLNPINRLPIRIMLFIHYMAVLGTILLQLAGKVDLIKSLYVFHIITPLGFALFALCLIWEAAKHKNSAAKRFGPASILLASSTILELINYWLSLTETLTIFFQLGVFAFIIALGIASGQYIRESVFTKAEKRRLEYEMSATTRLLNLQRQQYAQILENQAAVKAQRHDIKHQLAVINGLLCEGELERLRSYVNTLIVNIPGESDKFLSDNLAVNAVASYYYNLAKGLGINISIDLAVPPDLDQNTESDLCIIIGNLLENAIEACNHMDSEKRFIKLSSRLQYDTLAVTVDNSYKGEIRKKAGIFLSSKRDGEGIGTSSIIAIAERMGGNVKFEAENKVFMASVYVKLVTPQTTSHSYE